jgi:hypothetical protein
MSHASESRRAGAAEGDRLLLAREICGFGLRASPEIALVRPFAHGVLSVRLLCS